MSSFVHFIDGRVLSMLRAVELARRLRARGHEVTLVSPVDHSRPVAEAGIPFIRLTRVAELRRSVRPKPPVVRSIRQLTAILRWARSARRARRSSFANRDFEDVIRAVGPDAVLVDSEFNTAAIAAKAVGLPTALVTDWFMLFQAPDVPPLDSTLSPDATAATGRRIAWAWRSTRRKARTSEFRIPATPAGARHAVNMATRIVPEMTRSRRELRAFAHARGLSLRAISDRRQWQRPLLISGLPILSFSAPEMDFPHAPDPRFRYLGPVIAHEPWALPMDDDSGRAWRRLVDERESKREPGPLVYCALGSWWQGSADLLARIITALESEPHWDVVIGLGGVYQPESLPRTANATLLRFAPQLEVLRRADLAIIHGGTSILECVLADTPMVCYSLRVNDQNGNVARATYHGLAAEGDLGDDDGTILRRARTAMADGDQRRRIREMRQKLARYESSKVAERTIEELLLVRTPRR